MSNSTHLLTYNDDHNTLLYVFVNSVHCVVVACQPYETTNWVIVSTFCWSWQRELICYKLSLKVVLVLSVVCAGLKFDLTSVSSREFSSTWSAALPYGTHRGSRAPTPLMLQHSGFGRLQRRYSESGTVQSPLGRFVTQQIHNKLKEAEFELKTKYV